MSVVKQSEALIRRRVNCAEFDAFRAGCIASSVHRKPLPPLPPNSMRIRAGCELVVSALLGQALPPIAIAIVRDIYPSVMRGSVQALGAIDRAMKAD